ncbi:MAG TPA: hypothetical protein VNJ31_01860 [Methyloceanibacter sp.]|nr:hypothetical protein [Methyloceanibacter sp.]
MQWPDRKLMLALFAAGALSFLAGFAFVELIEGLPCSGEGLVCKINEAIGAYAVAIWAILGPLIFGLVLSIARNRKALLGAAIVLLIPPIAFFLLTQIEHTLYIGLEPERQFRTFLSTFTPPALAVLVQYIILRLAVPRPERTP